MGESNSITQRIKLNGITHFDFVLIVPIVAVSLLLVLGHGVGMQGGVSDLGFQATVYHEGQPTEILQLDRGKEIELLSGRMLLEIKENGLRVKHSDCPRQLCVHQGWVTHTGEKIVCVPFKTFIEITAEDKPFVDAVVY